MYTRFLLLLLSSVTSFNVFSQNDVVTEKKANLQTPTLNEISGMIFWNGKLYGHEDGGNSPVLFEIDSTTGAVTKTITLTVPYNLSIDDWEDITQDESYIYIGNFGNNANGSRTDLKFYRLPKQAITAISGATGAIPANEIEEINFRYPDQTKFCPDDFTCTDSVNNTTFDCEAVIVDNGVLHLFTKDWVHSRTVQYTVPAIPGTYIATRVGELNTGGLLITGATKIGSKVVALLGYENPETALRQLQSPECKLWLIMGFTDMNTLFSTASEKKSIVLGNYIYFPFPSPRPTEGLGQLEAISAVNATRVLIAGERFIRSITSPISANWDVPAQLYGVELGGVIPQQMILPEGISNFTSRVSEDNVILSWDYSVDGLAFFEVQASATHSDNDFTTIAKVNAVNTFPFTYTFSDRSVSKSEKKYYRIKATLADGRSMFSKIIFIRENDNAAFNLLAFPSPFKEKLNVNFNNTIKQRLSIHVVDVFGRSVITRNVDAMPGNYNLLIDGLQGLAGGVYFLTCKTQNDIIVRKILKQ